MRLLYVVLGNVSDIRLTFEVIILSPCDSLYFSHGDTYRYELGIAIPLSIRVFKPHNAAINDAETITSVLMALLAGNPTKSLQIMYELHLVFWRNHYRLTAPIIYPKSIQGESRAR
jgi:hypothetical protein